MSYPRVHAANDYGARKGPALAFVVHMAEGGGTVGYLDTVPPLPPRGVSVHYVIENSGRIVQMLDEDRASGSINPAELRSSDDPDGLYGATVRRSVMGAWDHDPNSAVISLEIEGFAKVGPTAAQHGALKSLVGDVRGRHPAIGLLGHRDFTSTKACPGRLVHWDDIGGHGRATEDTVGLSLTLPAAGAAGRLAIAVDVDAVRVSDGQHYRVATAVTRSAYVAQLAPSGSVGYLVDLNGDVAHFIRASEDVQFTPLAAGDCADAVAAEHERTRAQALAAVGGI